MTWRSTARSLTKSSSEIARFVCPSAIAFRTSRSRSVSVSSGPLVAAAPEHLGDDLGIEDRAAVIDPPHGVDEAVDLGDPVLEQVADTLAAGGEQVDRVVLLDVLRENQDPGLRQLLADRRRGAQAVVGVVRGHPDVDDRDVGLVGADLAEQVLGVGRLADDLDPGLVEEAGDPLPQQDRVLADHDSHGITALSLVPPPGGLVDLELAAERRDPVGEPAQPAAVERRPAAAVVADLDDERAVRPRSPRPRRGSPPRRGGRRSSAPRRRRSRRRPRPASGSGPRGLRRSWPATLLRLARPAQRRVEAALGQHRGVDAARELAQLDRRLAQFGRRLVEQLAGRGRVLVDLAARGLEGHRDADQLLLGAVVEVALDPAPRLVGGLDQPRPRFAQLPFGLEAVGDVAEVPGEDGRRRGRRSG